MSPKCDISVTRAGRWHIKLTATAAECVIPVHALYTLAERCGCDLLWLLLQLATQCIAVLC